MSWKYLPQLIIIIFVWKRSVADSVMHVCLLICLGTNNVLCLRCLATCTETVKWWNSLNKDKIPATNVACLSKNQISPILLLNFADTFCLTKSSLLRAAFLLLHRMRNVLI